MAASRIVGVTVEIGGDTTKLSKALSGVNKEISDTQKQLKDVDKLLKLDPGNTELMAQKHRLLGQAVQETKTKLDTLKAAEKQVQQQFKNGEVSREQYEALQREIIQTETDLKNLETQARKSNAVIAGLKNVSDVTGKIGSKLTSTGGKLTAGLTLPIVGVATAAVKTASEFEASMSRVEAVSGATGDELEALRAKAREMGAATKFSASESADALNYMAMAGWSVEDMLAGVEGVMSLAAASGEDLATTSDIVTDAMTALGISADGTTEVIRDGMKVNVSNVTHFADVLAQASRSSNTNVSMMGETFKYVAPVAGSLGYTAEDVALAIGLMANSGIKASQAGTALRGVLNRMAKPTKESTTAMNALGISLETDEGEMKSLRQVIDDMRKGFGKLKIPASEFNGQLQRLESQLESGEITEKEFNKEQEALMQRAYGAEGAMYAQYAGMLAGQNGMSGLLAIISASDEDYQKLIENIDGADGAAAEMASTMQNNLQGQIEILMSQLAELAISFVDLVMPAIMKVVGWIQQAVDWLNSLDEGQKNTILTIALVVAAIGPVISILGGLFNSISMITQGLSVVGQAIMFLISNPIVLLIAAIAGAVIAIGAYGDQIQEKLQAFDTWLQGIFVKDWTQVFGPVIGNLMNAFFKNLSNIWDSVKQMLNGIIDFVRGVFTGDWKRAWGGVKDVFGGIFKGLIAVAKTPINTIIGMINAMIGGLNAMTGGLANLKISIPDWVPGIGGKSFGGINVPKIPTLPLLAKGGVLSYGSAIVGEAGPELLTNAGGRSIVQPLTNNNTANYAGTTINVYAQPGQDVRELAVLISEELANDYEGKRAVFA